MRVGLMFSTPEINLFTAGGRLQTFPEDWKLTCVVSPSEMAEAGLFRCPLDVITAKYEDSVMCPYCGICLGGWEETDTGLGEHNRWSPNCPFIKTFPNGTTDPAECELIFPKPNNCCC
jgi:hypothetical protein